VVLVTVRLTVVELEVPPEAPLTVTVVVAAAMLARVWMVI
jgi:hypothetical protein